MSTPIEFEKDPVEAVAIHFGYSPEAAETWYRAYQAGPWKDYQVGTATYRARTRPEASQMHYDATGEWPDSLDDVVEMKSSQGE